MTSAEYLEEKEIKDNIKKEIMEEITEEIKVASDRYVSIQERVIITKSKDGVIKKHGYRLENYWKIDDFVEWYVNEKKECCYCKTSSEELFEFYQSTNSKRPRGQSLEIERVQDTEYTRVNCKLCCYWCNNAKSDFFSIDEFEKIGVAIGVVIQEKLRDERLKKKLLREELKKELWEKVREEVQEKVRDMLKKKMLKKKLREEKALLSNTSAP